MVKSFHPCLVEAVQPSPDSTHLTDLTFLTDPTTDVCPVTLAEQKDVSPEQLAERCQTGCRASFEKLVEQFESQIFNFLLRLTGNRHDAEDLTQDTFVKAYQNIHRYQPAYAFAAWLFTIAKRTAFSHFRAAKPMEEIRSDLQTDSHDPSTALEKQDDSRSLWELAKKLKPKQHEALWLRYGEGFSIAEVARIMKTNQIHVKVLLHRARTALAARLQRDRDQSL
ncbi:MAG: RNA polymerase sigma factor [Verrucomicrobia bacterium]|nr:RNA polymerase sigma factor [Verrucomicrobiota bacterium]